MLQLEIVLVSLPVVTAPAPNQTTPPLLPTATVAEPSSVALVMVLKVASFWNTIVAVPSVPLAVVLEIVSALLLTFRPSIVTLSAPLKLISALPAGGAPEIVRAAPPAGLIAIELYEADPEPLAFSVAVVFSARESPHTSMSMVPRWVPALTASKAALSEAYAVGPTVPAVASTSIGPAVSQTPSAATAGVTHAAAARKRTTMQVRTALWQLMASPRDVSGGTRTPGAAACETGAGGTR